ncbi:MAG: TatD family hydrolase [Planctomycetota bacterium]
MPAAPLVDSHCHLTWPDFEGDVPAVVERMAAAHVARAVVVATSVEDARRTKALAATSPLLVPTAGIHPNDLPEGLDDALAELRALVAAGGYVAVGETGLDYYRDSTEPDVQRRAFHAQCELAVAHDLPVIVHIRDRDGRTAAYDDVDAVIGSHEGLRGVIHCYTGGPDHARRYLDRGFMVSFAGILTFPKGENVREAARVVPLDRTMVETDAPFLAPVPYRGKRNEPAYVAHTAAALAALHGLEPDEIARRTSQVAADLFRFAVE